MDALASQIEDELGGTANPPIANLQVVAVGPYPFPTPPSIDIYPADPFQEPLAFGIGNNEFFFTVRARVATPDDEGGKRLLYSMMDPSASTSVGRAILADRSLGGLGTNLTIVYYSGVQQYGDGGPENQFLVGAYWTVQVF